MVVKYGPIAIALCLLINIWAVMRYREVYRDAIKSEVQLQQLSNAEQLAQGVLQDFSARAGSDAHIAEIFKQATAQVQAAIAAQRNPAVPAP
jgi:hypothetical protein